MDTLRSISSELVRSSQLRWTLFSVIANMSLTLSIWIGVYNMEVNSELSKTYFLDPSFEQTTGNLLLDGFINGVGTILVLGCVSFIMLAFVLFDFRRIVKAWLTLSCLLILFGVSAQTLHDMFSQVFDQDDNNQYYMTIVLIVVPTVVYGFGGIYAFFSNSSLILHQIFVVTNCSLISVFYLRVFPSKTTWFVLWIVLFWDLFAVLAPMGPLKKVQEKASDYSKCVLNLIMFSANEKRLTAGSNQEETNEGEESTIRRTVKQTIEYYTKREAQDDEFYQKIRQRRAAINPDSVPTEHSPLVEAEPSPIELKEKNSTEELSDDESDTSETSSGSSNLSSSDSSTTVSTSDISTAEECDQKEWDDLVSNSLPNNDKRPATAADALNDGEVLRLGFGDFVFYSLLIGQAAASGCPFAVISAALGILFGLVVTLTVFSTEESTTPALPLPVICGTFCYFSSMFFWEQLYG